jgi:fibro-slime domain-containing protein
MKFRNALVAGFSVSALVLCAQPAAFASSVSASYYTITSANPDIGKNFGLGAVKSTLGPDGLPVVTTPGTYTDVNASGELLWWTPHAGLVTAGTTFAYPNPVTLPFNITGNFFPNGPGGSNGGAVGYTSAVLSGSFNTPAGGSVTFTLGSDDDAWVFLNGQLIVDNGGIHGFGNAPTTISGLAAGTNTLLVFFDDRQTVQSGLYFDANVTVNPAVPEPSTWAMMLIGFAGLGFAGYKQARRRSVAA